MSAIKREVIIGDCRLILGDCLEVMKELEPVDCVVTDPPYGMDFVSNHRIEKHKPIANDGNLSMMQWACNLKTKHSSYIWMRWNNLRDVKEPKSLITWIKNNHSMGDLEHEHGRKTEVCAFYAGDDHFFPKGRPVDIVFGTRTGNNLHGTQKPVDLMRNVIEWTYGTVFDPFMGSGTTGVACVKSGRKFIGIELDETYFNIACERIQKAYDQPDFFVSAPSKQKEEQDSFEM